MNKRRAVLRQCTGSIADLERQDLTEQQIEQLLGVARAYPWIEFLDSCQEWQRLLFLKWRYETGQIGR